MVILIDTGATSNFLSRKLAEQLNLMIEETPMFTVEVENGPKEPSKGVCRDVLIEVQGINITQPFFLMELGGVDVVLGMKWLASLGEIVANFQQLTMRWQDGNTMRRLVGDPTLCCTECSWKATLKALKGDGEGFFITPKKEEAEAVSGLLVSSDTQRLLDEFEDFCKPPGGYPLIESLIMLSTSRKDQRYLM